jgi:hypothetical protein
VPPWRQAGWGATAPGHCRLLVPLLLVRDGVPVDSSGGSRA